MASKTISITEEVYELLIRMKLPHESIGDVIKRLCNEKIASSLVKWASERTLWSDMTEEEIEQVQGNIKGIKGKYYMHGVNFDQYTVEK